MRLICYTYYDIFVTDLLHMLWYFCDWFATHAIIFLWLICYTYCDTFVTALLRELWFLLLSLWCWWLIIQAFEHLLHLELVKTVDGAGSRVQKEYRLMQMLIHGSQIMEALQKYPQCPTDVRQWAASSLTSWPPSRSQIQRCNTAILVYVV